MHDVDLQPHRTRYWRTARLDNQFKQRAEKILWCYAYAERLVRRGFWVVCIDEMPNHQVLERRPIRRSIPGSIEQREFEYIRHGTVNILSFLIVHTGRMEATCIETKDALHYIEELKAFRQRHHHLRGVYLIQDGDPSHTAGVAQDYYRSCRGWWRPRFTPAHASWLNQAELLNHAFSYHYLRRGSWTSREEFIAHIAISWPVQRTLRSSLRVDVDESQDAKVVCGTCAVNSGHYLWPGTLASISTDGFIILQTTIVHPESACFSRISLELSVRHSMTDLSKTAVPTRYLAPVFKLGLRS